MAPEMIVYYALRFLLGGAFWLSVGLVVFGGLGLWRLMNQNRILSRSHGDRDI
jgi:hypothetical protein